MDFGQQGCFNVGLSIVINVLLWWGMLIIGQTMYMYGWGVFGISRNLSLNFLVNLKLLSKNSFPNLFKKVFLVISQSFTFIVKIKKSILNRHPIVLVQNYVLLKCKSVFCSHCIFFQAGSQAFLKNNLRMVTILDFLCETCWKLLVIWRTYRVLYKPPAHEHLIFHSNQFIPMIITIIFMSLNFTLITVIADMILQP